MNIFTNFTDDIILRRDNEEKASKNLISRVDNIETFINDKLSGNIPTTTAINQLDDINLRLSQLESTIIEQAKLINKLKKLINN